MTSNGCFTNCQNKCILCLRTAHFTLFLSGSRRGKPKIVKCKVWIDVLCHFFAFKMLVQCVRNIYEGYLGKHFPSKGITLHKRFSQSS